MTYSGNRWLSLSEMKVNAKYIFDYLYALGWSKTAICGMLGNMQSESTINPAIWQGLREGNTLAGYGLVQWTPASKFLNWCTANSLNPSEMDSALLRILYEVENGLQWYHPTMSFAEFSMNEDTPSNLAILFLEHYERPKNKNQPIRATRAEYWFSFLNDQLPPDENNPPDPTPHVSTRRSLKPFFYINKRRMLGI